MPRPPRCFSEGFYHLASHGSDVRHLFLSDDDRRVFLERLAFTFERFELALVAYTLMGNHYHLVLFTPDDRVSTALQQLHTWYSRTHNRTHGRSAHLFRNHFLAREIVDDDDLLTVCSYLAYNPVEGGLVDDPFDWPWSSAAATAGLCEAPIPLYEPPIRAALGDGPDWRQRYCAYLAADAGETHQNNAGVAMSRPRRAPALRPT